MDTLNREYFVESLKAGKTLCITRRDSPALPICLELEAEGLVTQEFKQIDEQSSVVKFRWKDD